MKVSYDQASDSLYVHLTDRAGSTADAIEDGVVLDFDTSGAMVGIDIQHASHRGDFTKHAVACGYRVDEDLFRIRLSNKQIVREASLDWRSHISYAADGSIVEIVFLDAKKSGVLPLSYEQAT